MLCTTATDFFFYCSAAFVNPRVIWWQRHSGLLWCLLYAVSDHGRWAVWLLKMWPVSMVKGTAFQEFVTGLLYSWKTGILFKSWHNSVDLEKACILFHRYPGCKFVGYVVVAGTQCSYIISGTWCFYIDRIWLLQRKLQSCDVLQLWLASVLGRPELGKVWNSLA